jgi:hypothetical protein
MLVLLSRFLLAFCLASILENWRQKIKIGEFFGSNIFGARATPDICYSRQYIEFCITTIDLKGHDNISHLLLR